MVSNIVDAFFLFFELFIFTQGVATTRYERYRLNR